ncbi:hypothetical protein STEG23_014949 [Scotinomys teguina]
MRGQNESDNPADGDQMIAIKFLGLWKVTSDGDPERSMAQAETGAAGPVQVDDLPEDMSLPGKTQTTPAVGGEDKLIKRSPFLTSVHRCDAQYHKKVSDRKKRPTGSFHVVDPSSSPLLALGLSQTTSADHICGGELSFSHAPQRGPSELHSQASLVHKAITMQS